MGKNSGGYHRNTHPRQLYGILQLTAASIVIVLKPESRSQNPSSADLSRIETHILSKTKLSQNRDHRDVLLQLHRGLQPS